jgi:hypothetical protein
LQLNPLFLYEVDDVLYLPAVFQLQAFDIERKPEKERIIEIFYLRTDE